MMAYFTCQFGIFADCEEARRIRMQGIPSEGAAAWKNPTKGASHFHHSAVHVLRWSCTSCNTGDVRVYCFPSVSSVVRPLSNAVWHLLMCLRTQWLIPPHHLWPRLNCWSRARPKIVAACCLHAADVAPAHVFLPLRRVRVKRLECEARPECGATRRLHANVSIFVCAFPLSLLLLPRCGDVVGAWFMLPLIFPSHFDFLLIFTSFFPSILCLSVRRRRRVFCDSLIARST